MYRISMKVFHVHFISFQLLNLIVLYVCPQVPHKSKHKGEKYLLINHKSSNVVISKFCVTVTNREQSRGSGMTWNGLGKL